jgi:hypothetical protein
MISDEMRQSAGRMLSWRVSFPIAESDIRRWAVAAYWPEPPPRQFWDREYALSCKSHGIVAPAEFNPFAWMVAAQEPAPAGTAGDGLHTERTLGITPPNFSHIVMGGQEIEYGVPMRPGDIIISKTHLAGYRERVGSTGKLLITVTEDVWTKLTGGLVKKIRMNMVRF